MTAYIILALIVGVFLVVWFHDPKAEDTGLKRAGTALLGAAAAVYAAAEAFLGGLF